MKINTLDLTCSLKRKDIFKLDDIIKEAENLPLLLNKDELEKVNSTNYKRSLIITGSSARLVCSVYDFCDIYGRVAYYKFSKGKFQSLK